MFPWVYELFGFRRFTQILNHNFPRSFSIDNETISLPKIRFPFFSTPYKNKNKNEKKMKNSFVLNHDLVERMKENSRGIDRRREVSQLHQIETKDGKK